MDECTCKWHCKNLASWTTDAKMEADAPGYVRSTSGSSWSSYLTSLKATSDSGWVHKVCEDVCSVGADTTKVKTYGVADDSSDGMAYAVPEVVPETTQSATDTTKISLPATAYATAKAARVKRTYTKTFKTGAASNGAREAKFEVTMQATKVAQCITEKKHWKTCCEIPEGRTSTTDYSNTTLHRNYANAKRFFEAHLYDEGSFKGGSCGATDGCWKSPSPLVTCGVKKSIIVFKICMTARKAGSTAAFVDDTRAESERCWNPNAKPLCPPKPLGNGAQDWRGDQTDSSQNSGFVDPLHCSVISSYGNDYCPISTLTKQETWSLAEGLVF
jgi:hypothetical protein